MTRPRLGLVTIGQSPRVDIRADIDVLLGPAEVVERGALDTVSGEQLTALAPGPGSEVLVSRLRDGSSVALDEALLLPLVQEAVEHVVARGAGAVLLLCTGHLPGLTASVPLFTAETLAHGAVSALIGDARLGVVLPDAAQCAPTALRWRSRLGREVLTSCADPYRDSPGVLENAVRVLAEEGAEWLFLDCMGYTEDMRRRAARSSGLPTLVARSAAARLAVEATLARG